jgi:hypothetical protein
MDLDAVADELYGLPTAEFTSVRDARATEARRTGDAKLATAIKKLRRPTTGAWIANLLVRERHDELTELLDLGGAMRQAQADLATGDLRRLSRQRHRLVAALCEEARHLALDLGQSLSDSAARELESTLEAALADAGSAAAVRSGRLTIALRYSGLGPVDLTGASGPATDEDVPRRPAPRGQPVDNEPPATDRLEQYKRHREDIKAAQRALEDALAVAADAELQVRAQERQLLGAREARDRCRGEIADLEQRLRDLQAAEERAESDLHQAQEASDALRGTAHAADDAVTRAQAALDRLFS